MKILITGANGQIGHELGVLLCPVGDLLLTDLAELDITNPKAVDKLVKEYKPDLIINTAAYTAVDKAESDRDLAMVLNGSAPGILAKAAKDNGAVIIHYSTDYVFDGTKESPYTEDDIPNPVSCYGKTKLAGEMAVIKSGAPYFIFRTSWIYGARGGNFLLTMLRLFKERDELNIVDDQRGSPTWSRTTAETTVAIVKKLSAEGDFKNSVKHVAGLYNLTCSGETTWFGFTSAIMENVKANGWDNLPKLGPIKTSEYKTPAQRPLRSTLSLAKIENTFGIKTPDWRAALDLCMKEIDL